MAFYVMLTAFPFWKRSLESKKIGESEAVERQPRPCQNERNAPGPVQRGGWVMRLYENPLTLAFFPLLLVSFPLHAWGGAREFTQDQLQHGGQVATVVEYLVSSRFWFECFQNWQSEFLALAATAILSIYLRQLPAAARLARSKPVDPPHSQTGTG